MIIYGSMDHVMERREQLGLPDKLRFGVVYQERPRPGEVIVGQMKTNLYSLPVRIFAWSHDVAESISV